MRVRSASGLNITVCVCIGTLRLLCTYRTWRTVETTHWSITPKLNLSRGVHRMIYKDTHTLEMTDHVKSIFLNTKKKQPQRFLIIINDAGDSQMHSTISHPLRNNNRNISQDMENNKIYYP